MTRTGFLLAAAFVLVFFLWFAGPGLRSGFMPDDMMNIYLAWQKPPAQLGAEFIPFHQPSDRPLGALVYKTIFAAAGLDPRPFRIFCFILLLCNLWLLFEVTRRVTASREIGLLAALLGCYNASCSDLYYSTATVYDLLCYLFYWGAVALYLRWRERGAPSWPKVALWCALLLLALDAKEVAVTLPAVIALYEVVFRRASASWRVAAVGFCIAAGAAASKFFAPGAIGSNAAYRMEFTAARLLGNLTNYFNMIFYRGEQLGPLPVLAIVAALLALALASRSRAAVWGWFVFFGTSLPVMLIPGRSLYALHVPLLGFWLLSAALLHKASEWLAPAWRWRTAALFLVTAFVLQHYHRWINPYVLDWLDRDRARVATFLEGLRRALPELPRGAQLVFLEDPHPADDYILTFVARLVYRDPTIVVLRSKQLARDLTPQEIAAATHLLRLSETDLTVVR